MISILKKDINKFIVCILILTLCGCTRMKGNEVIIEQKYGIPVKAEKGYEITGDILYQGNYIYTEPSTAAVYVIKISAEREKKEPISIKNAIFTDKEHSNFEVLKDVHTEKQNSIFSEQKMSSITGYIFFQVIPGEKNRIYSGTLDVYFEGLESPISLDITL